MAKSKLSDVMNLLKNLNLTDEEVIPVIQKCIEVEFKKKYGQFPMLDLILNQSSKVFEVNLRKTVVDEVKNPINEISLDDAVKIESDMEIGDELFTELTDDSFTESEYLKLRTNIQKALFRILDEKAGITKDNYGKVVEARQVSFYNGGIILVDENNVKYRLPYNKALPKDKDNIGGVMDVLIIGSKEDYYLVDRRSNDFIYKLFEKLVDGRFKYQVINYVRNFGNRCKILIKLSDRIDYQILRSISIELSKCLNGEVVDIVLYDEDPYQLIRNALHSFTIYDIWKTDDSDRIKILTEKSEFHKMLGANSINISMTQKLIDLPIKILVSKMDVTDDNDLREFKDVLPPKFIESIIKRGLKTAKQFALAKPYQLKGLDEDLVNDLRSEIRNELMEK